MSIRNLEQCVSIDEDDVLEWIRNTKNPEDVFTKESLEQWAQENDFVKKDA